MEYTPKYKIGDRVKITSNLSHSYSNVVHEMLKYAGEYVTITRLRQSSREDACYTIKEDKQRYAWGDNMIEHELMYEIF